jgi:hypothetical protein
MYVQTKLAHGDTFTVCWLPVDRRVKPGTIVTFVKGGQKWRVIEQWSKMAGHLINKEWRVGGLT